MGSLFIFLSFLPAALGLAVQICLGQAWDQRCLALALLLLCLDQARMAQVDWRAIAAVAAQDPLGDLRVDRFRLVTLSTIALELVGFYISGWYGGTLAGGELLGSELAATAWLAGGAVIVLVSQIWFHSLAGIQLQPGEAEPVVTLGMGARSPVLLADILGIGLVLLWFWGLWPLAMAGALLALVLVYGWVKYA